MSARDLSDGRRDPPAFQCYASDWLADRAFKAMSAVERGILFTILCECWCNRSVPSDPRDLARVLGLETSEVEKGLTPGVMRHLERQQVPEPVFVCPQLDEYRKRLDERRSKQSEGGKKGAEITRQLRQDRGNSIALPDGLPSGLPGVSLSRAKQSEAEQNVFQGGEHADFIKEIDGPAPFEIDAARSN